MYNIAITRLPSFPPKPLHLIIYITMAEFRIWQALLVTRKTIDAIYISASPAPAWWKSQKSPLFLRLLYIDTTVHGCVVRSLPSQIHAYTHISQLNSCSKPVNLI